MRSTLTITPSKLHGVFFAPPSKSQTLRAILFASLAEGSSVIENVLTSPDTNAMIAACRTFGADIQFLENNNLKIQGTSGQINATSQTINAGNSGIVLRFCAALAGLNKQPIHITGDDSIQNQRSVLPLMQALETLGAKVSYQKKEGFAPLTLSGPITCGNTEVLGNDSQFVSALLIALSLVQGHSALKVDSPGEIPWTQLTCYWLKKLQVMIDTQNAPHDFKITGGTPWKSFNYQVPGDISSAAFAIGAALITKSTLTIQNIDLNDPQGDNALIDHLITLGAQINISSDKKSMTLYPSNLTGASLDINPCIDSIAILGVIGCFAKGRTHLYNGAVARSKECNRIEAIVCELKKMGARIKEMPDGIVIEESTLSGACLQSHKDHRIAMSLAVAAFGATTPSTVHECDCINKTFPFFTNAFQRLGVKIDENRHQEVN